jgi:hypothetical protein
VGFTGDGGIFIQRVLYDGATDFVAKVKLKPGDHPGA